ncbi:hypothetical protein ABZ608_15110 [Streptomyces sp. NPDC013172]|uniref:hypothetical protein n=1 Tax=Streptomyces sp. NPDC013172 TaxID=3155009 RepID=UPI003410BD7E
MAKPETSRIPFALLKNFILTGESTVTRRTLPVATALAATAALLLTACGGGNDSSKDNDKITGAGAGGTDSPSPSASASADKNAPAFAFPSDVKVTVEKESTGDATRDAVLRDLAYAAQARLEGLVKGDGQTANMSRYYAADALVYFDKQIADTRKKGLTSTGSYRYYNFKVLDLSGQTATARYCEDQRQAFAKEIKTNTVHRTTPSNDDFIQVSVQTAKDSGGDWQVRRVSWKKATAECVQA